MASRHYRQSTYAKMAGKNTKNYHSTITKMSQYIIYMFICIFMTTCQLKMTIFGIVAEQYHCTLQIHLHVVVILSRVSNCYHLHNSSCNPFYGIFQLSSDTCIFRCFYIYNSISLPFRNTFPYILHGSRIRGNYHLNDSGTHCLGNNHL